MSPKKKTDSYNLYSCTHLSRAKINLKVDKTYAGRTKVLKYSSKPNPLLTINSITGQTTVFLPPSRSVLKTSNELENNRYLIQYDSFPPRKPSGSKFSLYSSFEDNEEHQMFSSEASTSDEYDFCFPDSNSRYLPNILKTKGTKAKNNFTDIQSPNENIAIKEKTHRKRKQTYNLSNIIEDDSNLCDSKQRMSAPKKKWAKIKQYKEEQPVIQNNLCNAEEEEPTKKRPKMERKCKTESHQKTKEEKVTQNIKKKYQTSCARVCPFVSNQIDDKKTVEINQPSVTENQENITQSQEDSEDTVDLSQLIDEIENNSEEFINLENLFPQLEAETDKCTESSVEAILGLENFQEFQSEFENIDSLFEENVKLPFPVDGEFITSDYWSYLKTNDSVEYSEDIHKLISPSLGSDFLDVLPSVTVVESQCDINGNDLKLPNLNFFDVNDEVNTDNFNHFSFEPKAPHFGVKDVLISGYDYEDFGCENDNYSSSSTCSSRQEDQYRLNDNDEEKVVENPQVIVELNKKFLSYGHVECYKQPDVRENMNFLVPDLSKSITPVDEVDVTDEVNIDTFKCAECDITFGKRRTLALHQSKAHLGFYSYTCERCSTLCNSKNQLQRHYKRCFPDTRKALTCHICEKKYSYRSSLKQHLRNKHNYF